MGGCDCAYRTRCDCRAFTTMQPDAKATKMATKTEGGFNGYNDPSVPLNGRLLPPEYRHGHDLGHGQSSRRPPGTVLSAVGGLLSAYAVVPA